MARGDFVKVTFNTLGGVETVTVVATTIGSSVDVDMGKAADQFVEVAEMNKGGVAVSTARFAKFAVLAIVDGHEKKAKVKK